MSHTAIYNQRRVSFIKKLSLKIFWLFRLDKGPSLKLYKGFGNETSCTIYGHALSLAPLPRKKYRNFFVYNSVALLRLFMVRPLKRAKIILHWENEAYETETEDDGFFHFEWTPAEKLKPGSYTVRASLMSSDPGNTVSASAEEQLLIPSPTHFAFISDIDDTFLISHSSNLRKRLFVLLTENARSRRPFEGAVKHYRMLSGTDDSQNPGNAFFYVSSSEWNLYNYIREFVRINKLPDGIFLLNQLKTFSKLFSTGQSKHSGKFTRIVKIIEAFPHQRFVLLGDDSQQDPDIYASVVEHFPANIYCVYIRRVNTPEKTAVREKQQIIEKAGVLFYYFAHSHDAIVHSETIGLIRKT